MLQVLAYNYLYPPGMIIPYIPHITRLSQGVPNQRISNDNCAVRIDHTLLWSLTEIKPWRTTDVPEAIQLNQIALGMTSFQDRNMRKSINLADLYPTFDPIFHALVNVREGLLFYCDVTFRLSHS